VKESKFIRSFNIEQLTDDYIQWLRTYGEGRNFNGLRFGQSLFSKYCNPSETFPELFYAEGVKKAYDIAYMELM